MKIRSIAFAATLAAVAAEPFVEADVAKAHLAQRHKRALRKPASQYRASGSRTTSRGSPTALK